MITFFAGGSCQERICPNVAEDADPQRRPVCPTGSRFGSGDTDETRNEDQAKATAPVGPAEPTKSEQTDGRDSFSGS
jgi:hypothetical protein